MLEYNRLLEIVQDLRDMDNWTERDAMEYRTAVSKLREIRERTGVELE